MTETPSSQPGGAARPAVWRRANSAAYVASAPGSPDRAVVLDLTRPELPPYVFEGSAAQIWGALDGERTETEIATELARAHGLSVGTIARDVHDFVVELASLGLAQESSLTDEAPAATP